MCLTSEHATKMPPLSYTTFCLPPMSTAHQTPALPVHSPWLQPILFPDLMSKHDSCSHFCGSKRFPTVPQQPLPVPHRAILGHLLFPSQLLVRTIKSPQQASSWALQCPAVGAIFLRVLYSQVVCMQTINCLFLSQGNLTDTLSYAD